VEEQARGMVKDDPRCASGTLEALERERWLDKKKNKLVRPVEKGRKGKKDGKKERKQTLKLLPRWAMRYMMCISIHVHTSHGRQ
jgi:hypothetical protein